jgi:hypothetical protein
VLKGERVLWSVALGEPPLLGGSCAPFVSGMGKIDLHLACAENRWGIVSNRMQIEETVCDALRAAVAFVENPVFPARFRARNIWRVKTMVSNEKC